MRPMNLLTMLAASAMLAGCGGGGGSADPGTAPSLGPGSSTGDGSTKPTAGVWQGTITSSTTGTARVMGLTGTSGPGIWMATDGRVWTGQVPMSGTQMTATMAAYMYPGRQFPDGSNHGPWSMTGAYANGAWSGQFSGTGDSATFQFSMHPAFERPASLDQLASTYTRTTSIGYTMTLSVTQGGQLTGSDSRGCVFNGSVTVPDPSHNLYQLDVVATSCGILNGTYAGRGTLLDATAMQAWTGSMGCFQYGSGGWGGGMMGGGMGGWWPYSGSNTVPSGTTNLFMFAMTNGTHAIMDALAK